MEMNSRPPEIDFIENRERVEAALVRLKSLKSNVTQIRLQVESLRRLQDESREPNASCAECGKEIEHGQEVTIKDPSGNPRRFYHRECFKALWISQSWSFDYSSPGFLKPSKEVKSTE
jgi:hypothetical protein